MKNRIIQMCLFITACMAIIIILCSPSFLFNGLYRKDIRNLAVYQTIAPQRLFIVSWRNIKSSYIDPSMNHQDWNKWKYKYLKYIKTDEDVKVAVNTMLASLNDEYSEFYDNKKYTLQEKYIKDNVDSLSTSKKSTSATVELDTIAGLTYSAKVVKKSDYYENPQEDDVIISIDNYPICGMEMNSAAKLIRGISTFSKVEVLRNNKKYTYSLNSGSMDIRKIKFKHIEDNIVYISVYSLMGFKAPNTFKMISEWDNDIKGYIIDLRGNVGGLFLNAIYIADIFVKEGELTKIKYRDGRIIPVNANYKEKVPKKPIVVLINKETASSSEILAGALRRNNRAILVGEPTYGKNIIQQIIYLPNKTCINLSSAKFVFEENKSPRGIIEPDYIVPITLDDILSNNDTQLNKAVELIKTYKENRIDD